MLASYAPPGLLVLVAEVLEPLLDDGVVDRLLALEQRVERERRRAGGVLVRVVDLAAAVGGVALDQAPRAVGQLALLQPLDALLDGLLDPLAERERDVAVLVVVVGAGASPPIPGSPMPGSPPCRARQQAGRAVLGEGATRPAREQRHEGEEREGRQQEGEQTEGATHGKKCSNLRARRH